MPIESVRIGEWHLGTETDCSIENSTFCAPPPIDIKVVGNETHPDYDRSSSSKHHDIALLRLARKVNFNEFVKPVCLPLDPEWVDEDFTDYDFQAVGFGKFIIKVLKTKPIKISSPGVTEEGHSSDSKLYVDLPYVSHADCTEKYSGTARTIVDSQVCINC
jgi:hypothetical protein